MGAPSWGQGIRTFCPKLQSRAALELLPPFCLRRWEFQSPFSGEGIEEEVRVGRRKRDESFMDGRTVGGNPINREQEP